LLRQLGRARRGLPEVARLRSGSPRLRRGVATIVRALRGWRDLRTLQNAYQRVDDATLLAVVNEPRKLREIRSDEAAG
jgi:hypothetical protein